LIYVSKNNLDIIKDRVYGSPDLVVEIVSSSSINYDNRIKFELYEKYKVKEYWIIDPKYKMIEIFTLENDKYNSYCSVIEEGEAGSKIIEGFKINIKDIFSQ
jgi:Uma2 family endonuclease